MPHFLTLFPKVYVNSVQGGRDEGGVFFFPPKWGEKQKKLILMFNKHFLSSKIFFLPSHFKLWKSSRRN